MKQQLTENTEIALTTRTAAALIGGLVSIVVAVTVWAVMLNVQIGQMQESIGVMKDRLEKISVSTGEICRDLIRDNPRKKDWLKCY